MYRVVKHEFFTGYYYSMYETLRNVRSACQNKTKKGTSDCWKSQ